MGHENERDSNGRFPKFDWMLIILLSNGQTLVSEKRLGFTVEDAENITRNMSKDFPEHNVCLFKLYAKAYTPGRLVTTFTKI